MDYVIDVHTYAQPARVVVKHLELDLVVDFQSHILSGYADLHIQKYDNTDTIILDCKDLEIKSVKDKRNNEELPFTIGPKDVNLGSPLAVKLNKETNIIRVHYSTSKTAEALQWLEPAQTQGKKAPFLFTQSQAILARSWMPIQDSPGIRFTYSAKITVPKHLMAVMSATNPTQLNNSGVYTFEMSRPIPAYLMALAVGNLSFHSLGIRTGVYAEPEMLKKATYEFEDLEKMLVAAEDLYGQYKWERYDVIVLPPSFPFGGMENPKLTFATPTIIAGDRSLTSLIAHELAHSWSGNLVTNATWDDFWLNEGFTVYFENRIMEKLKGKEYAEMLAYLGFQSLQKELEDMGNENPDTRLKLDLKGRNPDDGVTHIAYEKGYLFLRNIEEAVGRKQWDAFMSGYFTKFQFKAMDTESFLRYLDLTLIKGDETLKEKINAEAWVYKPGIPSQHPLITSAKFDHVDNQLEQWLKNNTSFSLKTSEWSTHEWVHFINSLPENLDKERMKNLDELYHLTASKNSEIQFAWYLLSIKKNYSTAFPEMEVFLKNVGRRKFILPLYKELAKTEHGKKFAKEIYSLAKPTYHFVAKSSIDQVLYK